MCLLELRQTVAGQNGAGMNLKMALIFFGAAYTEYIAVRIPTNYVYIL